MKIDFTKKQYEGLLKLCYIGNWMANAQRSGSKDDPRVKKFEEIYEYIESHAPEFDLGNLVQWDEECKRYFTTADFEKSDDIHVIIDEYDENAFWDDLVEKLTDHDFSKTYTKKDRKKMSFEEFYSKRQPFEDKWNKEVYKYGVTRLKLPREQA